jgi:hypothetical protein
MAARQLIDEQLSIDPVAVSVARTMRRVVQNREGIIADVERHGGNVPVPGQDDMDREGALRLRAVQIDEDGRIGALFTKPSRFEGNEDKVMAFGRMVDGVAAFDGFKQTRVVSVGRGPGRDREADPGTTSPMHGSISTRAEFLESLPPGRSADVHEPFAHDWLTGVDDRSAIPSSSGIGPASSFDGSSMIVADYGLKVHGDRDPSARDADSSLEEPTPSSRSSGVAPKSVRSLDLDDIVSPMAPRPTTVHLNPTPRPFGVAPLSVVSLDLDDIVSPASARGGASRADEGRSGDGFKPRGRVMHADGIRFEGGRDMPSRSMEQIAIQQILSKEMVAFGVESKESLGMFRSRMLDDGEMRRLPSGLTKGPKVADVAQAAWSRMKGALGIGG